MTETSPENESVIETSILKSHFDDARSNILKNTAQILEASDFFEVCEKLEESLGITIVVEEETKTLMLLNENLKIIGIVSLGSFKSEGINSKNHIYKNIDSEYRGLGLGYMLLVLFQKYVGEAFPKVDYTKKVSVISVYKKLGYKPIYKISDGQIEYITDADNKLFQELKERYKAGIEEKKLPFLVVLKKYDDNGKTR